MSSQKRIVIVCNLDTRGEDILFVKDLIAGRGIEPALLDFSMEEPPPFPGDITTEEVALRGGGVLLGQRHLLDVSRLDVLDRQMPGGAEDQVGHRLDEGVSLQQREVVVVTAGDLDETVEPRCGLGDSAALLRRDDRVLGAEDHGHRDLHA
mgnify:CR=1 FL=1